MELLLPLSRGGRVVIADRMEVADGSEFAAAVERHRVDILQATPAGWRLLLEGGWGETRWMKALCGGEALPAALAAELVQRSAGVWNLYGPTETTIWSSASRLASDKVEVSIGGPIQNTQMYALDEWMEPAPVGVIGQIYIGGEGLARGYCRQPGLSAERFVPDELGEEAGGRLYRTGDLGRYRADGALEFVGRCDHQVKIRGYRIELGEIESVLSRHPAVKQAVVLAREDEPGEKYLVAYVVPDREKQASSQIKTTMAEIAFGEEKEEAGDYERYANHPAQVEISSMLSLELRDYAREKLPEYMMPSAIVELRHLPMTPSGKVDRKALPAPRWEGETEENETAGDLGPVEEVLAGIWTELLKRDRIGVKDNFFKLGGHSLMAVRLISRVHARFGVELQLRDIFTSTTIERVAQLVEKALLTRLSPDKLDELLNQQETFDAAANERPSL